MDVRATWQGKRQFTAVGPSGHAVTMDAKADLGGEDKGARPMELLLMGLAGCTGIDVTMIMDRMRQDLQSLEIEVTGTRRDEYPQAFTQILLTYRMAGNIEPAKAWRAIRLSEDKYCSASASLKASISSCLYINGEEMKEDRDIATEGLPD